MSYICKSNNAIKQKLIHMITRKNISEVVAQLSDKDKRRLANTDKEYAVLELSTFNTGSVTNLKLTDNYTRYQNVSDRGDCILYADDPIFDKIKETHND